jgi:methyl-accepting chemotaxis protein
MYSPGLSQTLQEQVQLAESVMDTTAQGLEVASQTLESTRLTLQTLDETVQTFSQAITDTVPLLDTIGAVVGEDLPKTIASTQTSLNTAQQSARVIDGILRTLTAIPFFPGDPYQPQVPLHVALSEVSRSLNGLPESFRAMQDNLTQSSANLATAQADIQRVRGEVVQVKSSLKQAQQILSQYRETALTLRNQLESLRLAIPVTTRWASLFLSLFWLWLAMAQLGLLTQGLELSHRQAPQAQE